MGASEPRARRSMSRGGLAQLTIAPALALAACAGITGLSDDYRFEVPDGGAAVDDGGSSDAGPTEDGPASSDASGGQCSKEARDEAQATLADAGEPLPPSCRDCLADACCVELAACASSPSCAASLRCVLDCQDWPGGGKRQCLDGCGSELFTSLGPCLDERCPAPNCALR